MRLKSKSIDCKRMEACDERTPLAGFFNSLLTTSHGPHYEKRFSTCCDRIG